MRSAFVTLGLMMALAILFASTFEAGAFGLGKEGILFSKLGAIRSKPGTVIPQPTGKILLADGSSFILKTDGVSKFCRAGGC